MFGSETVLYETDTSFGHYAVVERVYEGRSARLLFSGGRRAAQSGIALDDSPDLLFDYNQRCLELASNLYPKRILMVGGGAYTLPMALATALPDAQIDVVEQDDGLPAIARRFFGLRATANLQLHAGDGRQFLAASDAEYDLIIVDVFNELEIPAGFLTVEWAKTVHAHLAKGGVLMMNIIASVIGRNTELICSQLAAYDKVFKNATIFPAAHGLTGWLPQNLLLTAQKKPAQDLTHFVRYAALEAPDFNAGDIRHDLDNSKNQ